MRAGSASSAFDRNGTVRTARARPCSFASTSFLKCSTIAGASASRIFIRTVMTGLPVAEEAGVACPAQGAVDAGVGDRMAREAGLRVGLGGGGAAEHVGDGALARARPTDDGDVDRRRRLVVEEGADAVARQGRGEP